MILHKTTVCLTVWLCVCSPPPLATVVALNRQILIFGNSFCRSMTSFLHRLTAALTRKDEISNSQISKTQKQKLVSLFYFRFLPLLPFFRRIFLQICFVIFVYCFCSSSAVGSINWQTVRWKLKRCFGDQQRDRQTKRPHGQLAANAASFKALKSKPRSGESRLPCPEIEIENA